MARKKRDKNEEQNRFYLFPGQGGKAYRRKQRIIIAWSIVVALVISAIFAGILYLVNNSHS
jgi:hypothetical protein